MMIERASEVSGNAMVPLSRSLGQTVLLALVPGLVILVVPYGVVALNAFGRTAVLSSYYVIETILLFGIMSVYARRSGLTLRAVIGYNASVKPAVFILLAAFGALWAIGVRDYLRMDWIMTWAGAVQSVMPEGWPSIFARLPGHDALFEGDGLPQVFGLIVATSTVVLASLAQTLYFRGFLLSGIDRMGLMAPTLVTLLFVVFHMGSPPFWHVFLMLTLPWAFIAYRTKNVWIVAVSHMVMNGYHGIFALVGLTG